MGLVGSGWARKRISGRLNARLLSPAHEPSRCRYEIGRPLQGPQASVLRAVHKEILGFERIEVVSDEMRALIEELWPKLVHKLPPRE
jgi:hypothetical protein